MRREILGQRMLELASWEELLSWLTKVRKVVGVSSLGELESVANDLLAEETSMVVFRPRLTVS